jgi:hypothetical protein
METYRFNTKHNAEVFQYSILSKNSGHYEKWTAKLDGLTVRTNAPEWVIDSAYKDLGAYGRDPSRRRRRLTGKAARRLPSVRRRQNALYQVCQGERVVRKGLDRDEAFGLAERTAKRTRKPARVEKVTKVGTRTRFTQVAAFGRDGKRIPAVSAFGKRIRSGRDVSRADLRHLSLSALMKLLRQAIKAGDEDKAEMIGKELDRRGGGYKRGGR